MSSRLVFFQVSPRRHSNKVTFQGTKYRQTGYLKVVLGCIFQLFFFNFVAETRTACGRNSHHHWRSSVWTASGKMRVGTGGRGEADFVFTTTMLGRTFDTNMTVLSSPSCCSRSHTPWRRFTRCAVFSCIFVYKWSVYYFFFVQHEGDYKLSFINLFQVSWPSTGLRLQRSEPKCGKLQSSVSSHCRKPSWNQSAHIF